MASDIFFNNGKKLFQFITGELNSMYGKEGSSSMAYLILENIFHISRTDIITGKPIEVTSEQTSRIEAVIKRIKLNEPIQYIMGETEFYGRKFRVTPDVLIPRPETEELVYLILSEHGSGIRWRILDIGTGSGCIPVTIKNERPEAHVYAVDVSSDALAVASENAKTNGAQVYFIQADVLREGLIELAPMDIIVSNPPYVCEKEKDRMKRNVLDHEPSLALFVENSDPLLFYRRITALAAASLLNKGGKIYFEINEAYGRDIVYLLETSEFSEVRVFKDMQGKDRMVRGRLR